MEEANSCFEAAFCVVCLWNEAVYSIADGNYATSEQLDLVMIFTQFMAGKTNRLTKILPNMVIELQYWIKRPSHLLISRSILVKIKIKIDKLLITKCLILNLWYWKQIRILYWKVIPFQMATVSNVPLLISFRLSFSIHWSQLCI